MCSQGGDPIVVKATYSAEGNTELEGGDRERQRDREKGKEGDRETGRE